MSGWPEDLLGPKVSSERIYGFKLYPSSSLVLSFLGLLFFYIILTLRLGHSSLFLIVILLLIGSVQVIIVRRSKVVLYRDRIEYRVGLKRSEVFPISSIKKLGEVSLSRSGRYSFLTIPLSFWDFGERTLRFPVALKKETHYLHRCLSDVIQRYHERSDPLLITTDDFPTPSENN